MPRENKVNDPRLQQKVKELLRKTTVPVSVDFVAYNIGVSWSTTRVMLLELALKGEIAAEKTSKSWIFRKTSS